VEESGKEASGKEREEHFYLLGGAFTYYSLWRETSEIPEQYQVSVRLVRRKTTTEVRNTLLERTLPIGISDRHAKPRREINPFTCKNWSKPPGWKRELYSLLRDEERRRGEEKKGKVAAYGKPAKKRNPIKSATRIFQKPKGKGERIFMTKSEKKKEREADGINQNSSNEKKQNDGTQGRSA